MSCKLSVLAYTVPLYAAMVLAYTVPWYASMAPRMLNNSSTLNSGMTKVSSEPAWRTVLRALEVMARGLVKTQHLDLKVFEAPVFN